MKGLRPVYTLVAMLLAPLAYADVDQQTCLLKALNEANADMTVAQVRAQCLSNEDIIPEKQVDQTANRRDVLASQAGAISHRLSREWQTAFDPYVITPHKMNYILPAYTTNAINRDAYSFIQGYEDNLEDIETKFQLSFKVPLLEDSLFIDGDALYLGFTLQAWWQIYASNLSKPFRETNYQPELFYVAPLKWQPMAGNTAFVLGVEHQSNGRGLELSRSWNRLYTALLFEKQNFGLSLRPWVRLSEEDKQFPLDPSGDDNPDIDEFMGHFELSMAYRWHEYELTFMGRQNFSTQNGAAELGFTFPLWGRMRGYATAFTGYGDSLIDYNYNQTRFGIGVALTSNL